MSAKIEGMMNSNNLGERIMENEVLDMKIWAFEALGVKQTFQKVLGAYLEFP
jgi:hypothetical protein